MKKLGKYKRTKEIRGKNRIASLGIKNGNYIDGRSSKTYYCIEHICDSEISYWNWLYGSKRCASCASKGKHEGNKNGMFGKHRSDRIKKIISKTHKGLKASETTRKKMSENNTGRGNPHFGKPIKPKWGKYKSINMRSSWEINYAKWLDKNNIKWEYEPDTFNLGYTTYTPDFKLNNKKYIEIKGWMSPEAYFKIKKFILANTDIDYAIMTEKDLKKIGALK